MLQVCIMVQSIKFFPKIINAYDLSCIKADADREKDTKHNSISLLCWVSSDTIKRYKVTDLEGKHF